MTVIAAPLAFSSSAFDEAIGLLHETRNQLLISQATDDGGAAERLQVNAEYSRVAARLAHVVAWLMAQKAVQNGELNWAKALQGQQPLTTVATCTDDATVNETTLPDDLRDLLTRSRALYARVARLDEQARSQFA